MSQSIWQLFQTIYNKLAITIYYCSLTSVLLFLLIQHWRQILDSWASKRKILKETVLLLSKQTEDENLHGTNGALKYVTQNPKRLFVS